jgi:hypothetical protein
VASGEKTKSRSLTAIRKERDWVRDDTLRKNRNEPGGACAGFARAGFDVFLQCYPAASKGLRNSSQAGEPAENFSLF